MATNIYFFFFRQHAARFSATILPFNLCESITATKQNTAVHWHAQIIHTPPSPQPNTHKQVHVNRQITHQAWTHCMEVRISHVTHSCHGEHICLHVHAYVEGLTQTFFMRTFSRMRKHQKGLLLQTNWTLFDLISLYCWHTVNHSQEREEKKKKQLLTFNYTVRGFKRLLHGTVPFTASNTQRQPDCPRHWPKHCQ